MYQIFIFYERDKKPKIFVADELYSKYYDRFLENKFGSREEAYIFILQLQGKLQSLGFSGGFNV